MFFCCLTGVLTHMNSKLHVEEYSGRYRQLVAQQNQSYGDQQMPNFVNIIGGSIFQGSRTRPIIEEHWRSFTISLKVGELMNFLNVTTIKVHYVYLVRSNR
jgi:hypothetical protein